MMKLHAGALSRVDIRTVVSVGLMIALIAPFAMYAVPQVAGADHSYVVLSGSMEPAINVGDVVIVERVPPRTIERGDIITFSRGGEDIPTTHRVVDVVQSDTGLAFETKGDANEDPDPSPVAANRVIGRVAFTIPLIGYVIDFASTQVGFVVLVILPLGLLFLTELWAVYQGRRADATTTATAASADAEETPADEPSSTEGALDESVENDIPDTVADTATAGVSGSDEFQLTDRHLTVGIAVSGLGALIAGYAAYELQTGWVVALATAFGGVAVLLLAIKYDWLEPSPDDDFSKPSPPGVAAMTAAGSTSYGEAATSPDPSTNGEGRNEMPEKVPITAETVSESLSANQFGNSAVTPEIEGVRVIAGQFTGNGIPRVKLADYATLSTLVAGDGGRIIADSQKNQLVYVTDGVVYTAPYPSERTDEENNHAE